MSRHTQEPWKLSINTDFGWVTNPYSVWVRKPGVHTVTVANIPARKTITWEERLANARLIAAAPDLLAQLVEAEALLCRLYESQPLSARGTAAIDSALSDIRAAITKATKQEGKE